MKQSKKESAGRLSAEDSRLIDLIRGQIGQSPPPSLALQRSLREIPIRSSQEKRKRTVLARTNMAVGACVALLALLLFSSAQPGRQAASEASPFEELSGNWSYELFAPLEYERFDPVYESEFSLPPGYNALEYWVY
ncbi:MAG: hypothetical protein VX252_04610 [Myxococcota bacterium]|nr:hypothetical protein [Myxococcota bacterium]